MLTFIVIGLLLFILLYLLSMVWPPDSPWSPWWRTSEKTASMMCKMAKISKDDIIYDLGSGEGVALITAAKKYGARGVGVEIDPLRFMQSVISVYLSGVSRKIRIVRKNFFAVDTSEATVVFMYLIPKTLARLKPKLLKELKPGTRIVTYVYKIDLPMIAKDEKNEIYIYKVPKK